MLLEVFDKKLFAVFSLCILIVCGRSNAVKPRIGYLYPSGGQQGTVVQVMAGGQFLRGTTDVYISGEGVHASVIKYIRPLGNLNKERRELIQERLKEARQTLLGELPDKGGSQPRPRKKRPAKKDAVKAKGSKKQDAVKKEDTVKKQDAVKKQEVKFPEHPLLYDMENKSLRELAHITNVLFASRGRRQPNRQLAESVLIEVTIDPDAAAGDRELRFRSGNGLTNPMVFQVGSQPEVLELEPNNKKAYTDLPNVPKGKPLELPVVLNGQIMPGDIDRFCFRAKKGQQLVMEAQARSLIPYLADAVPGWFQATLALYDDKGNEVAFADDYRFDPDPVLFYRIPKDGEYELEIRDSIYRGREDFVYRVAVGEQPFITHVFPLGGRAGVKTVASVAGWNLPETRLPLDTKPDGQSIRQTACRDGKWLSNSISYAVDTLPECDEAESNDTIKLAQKIDLPKIVNGRIDKPGDIDVFEFKGRAGDKLVAEVYGRRLNSPLDSLLKLTDASGKVLELNDDHVIKDSHLHKNVMGLITHHSDSYLLAELPKDGTYYVHLADSQHHGGKAYGYRLRVSGPQGDFALCVTPSSLGMRAGAIVPVCVHALRKDGFDGKIEVTLKNAPPGFELKGGFIPAGRDRVRMTLTAPPEGFDQPVVLQLQGSAWVGEKMVSRPVIGADDVMQAYLYRHLVPSQELMVAVQKIKWRPPSIELAGRSPVRVPAGGEARVLIKTRRRPAALRELRLELSEPPEGISLCDVTVVNEGLEFQLKADKDCVQIGFMDNLIVEVFREYVPKQKDGKPANKKRRASMGVLPAIPIEIVRR